MLSEGKPSEQKVIESYTVDEYYSNLISQKRYKEKMQQQMDEVREKHERKQERATPHTTNKKAKKK